MTPLGGRALVVGSDTRSFLGAVRSLGRAGIEVHTAGCPLNAPALRSKYVHKAHAIRPSAVPDYLKSARFDLVIPCDDFAMLPLHLRRRELAGAKVAMPDEDAFRIVSDKQRTYELAARLNIPLPRQVCVRSFEEIEAVAGKFGWPLVLKPATSVTAADPGSRNAVRKAWNMAEARAVARPAMLVQENFIGIGVGVEVLCKNGEVLVAFQHERVHEPLQGGGSTYRKSVPLTPDLLDAARRLMGAMRYTGVGMVEFKFNPRTNEWILIEINGRFWGSLPLSIDAGADFPRYLYEMLVHGRTDFPQKYRTGVYARNWMLDARWLARNLLSNRRDPTLMSRPLWKVMLEPLNLGREHSDTLVLYDPGPAWGEIGEVVRSVLRPLTRAVRSLTVAVLCTLLQAQNRDHKGAEFNSRVLFVCKGNVCRSPFAAEYFRRIASPGIQVESAGYYQKPGRRPPATALEAARRFGVELSAHRSQVLNAGHVERADVIFIFEYDQERELLGWFPEAAGKVRYLGGKPIRDPWGRNIVEFVRVYREIELAIIAASTSSHRPAYWPLLHITSESERRDHAA